MKNSILNYGPKPKGSKTNGGGPTGGEDPNRPMTRKEYKAKLKDAKRQNKIAMAKAGTLGDKRAKTIGNVVDIAGKVLNAAASGQALISGRPAPRGMGRGNDDIFGRLNRED